MSAERTINRAINTLKESIKSLESERERFNTYNKCIQSDETQDRIDRYMLRLHNLEDQLIKAKLNGPDKQDSNSYEYTDYRDVTQERSTPKPKPSIFKIFSISNRKPRALKQKQNYKL